MEGELGKEIIIDEVSLLVDTFQSLSLSTQDQWLKKVMGIWRAIGSLCIILH